MPMSGRRQRRPPSMRERGEGTRQTVTTEARFQPAGWYATRKPRLPVVLSGVLLLRESTRYRQQ